MKYSFLKAFIFSSFLVSSGLSHAALIEVYSDSFESGGWGDWNVIANCNGVHTCTSSTNASIHSSGFINAWGGATSGTDGNNFLKLDGSYSATLDFQILAGDIIEIDYLSLFQLNCGTGRTCHLGTDPAAYGIHGRLTVLDDLAGGVPMDTNGAWTTVSGTANVDFNNLTVTSAVNLLNVLDYTVLGGSDPLLTQQLFIDNVRIFRDVEVPEPPVTVVFISGLFLAYSANRKRASS